MMPRMALRQAHRVGYVEIVTDFFTGIRGRGLVLSPAELDLVRAWEARGIPAEVVCRGIEMGVVAAEAVRPGRPPPQRLAYYSASVEEAFRAAREKAVGREE